MKLFLNGRTHMLRCRAIRRGCFSTPFLYPVSHECQGTPNFPRPGRFNYGAFYADLADWWCRIPPNLVMQDVNFFTRIFAMFIATASVEKMKGAPARAFKINVLCKFTATILGLAPYPLWIPLTQQQKTNQSYFET